MGWGWRPGWSKCYQTACKACAAVGPPQLPSLQTDRAGPLMAGTCGVRDWLGLGVLTQGQVHSACEHPC